MGAGSGTSCTKHLHSFEVYNDPAPVTAGEESGSAGMSVASVVPVPSVA